jgi:hypothetical protein
MFEWLIERIREMEREQRSGSIGSPAMALTIR